LIADSAEKIADYDHLANIERERGPEADDADMEFFAAERATVALGISEPKTLSERFVFQNENDPFHYWPAD
jgi:hypothetical protein